MNDFIECLGIEDVIRKSGHDPHGNFEAIYSQIYRTGNSSVLNELNSTIRDYFSKITIPDVPTVYDYLVVSMRSKDVIITFNWNPLLPQAYKRWRHLGAVLPQLLFLHGNVDIGVDIDKRAIGFLSDGPYPGHTLVPSKLLYPIDKKNYNDDPFVSESWRITTNYLSDAYNITIFGYSAPTTDVEARALLLKAWKDNLSRELAYISIVDIRDPLEVKKSWADFDLDDPARNRRVGASSEFLRSDLIRHPRRSCEAFAFATLQQDPWRADPFPPLETISLAQLEAWITPVIEEEHSGRLSGKPLH
jgi:hypothetical protein